MTDLETHSPGGSTIAAASEIEERASPMRGDPRTSLQHVLGDTDSQRNTPAASKHTNDMTEDDDTKAPSMSTSRKRKDHSGTNNPLIYSGNKVRHLKKDDGEPLWRTDIQYDFLKLIFEDTTACFTNSYVDNGKQTFASVYIDAMARSSKTSKILRDKLLSEHEPAKNMAMVCLLVNLGRMNTTLNCL